MALQWIRKWFERRRLRDRALFAYRDGTRERYADPAEVWRKLLNHPTMNFVDMMPLAEQGQEPEVSVVLDALAEIFDVDRWDESTGRGLTNWETLDLVHQFDAYLNALKKNISTQRMPLLLSVYGQRTGSPHPQPDPAAEPSMNSTADSSSMPAESSADEATTASEPLPTE